jgi:putative oxidoreductase
MLRDLALLTLRITVGGLLAGHGSQKLFGWFGGYGPRGTAGWLESLGIRPGDKWAYAAGATEFGGGLLTLLGLFSPVGPITMLAPMSVAVGKVHWGKPIWVTEGGAELPVTNAAAGMALALAGPGRFSLDRAFGIRVPWALAALAAGATAAGITLVLSSQPAPSAVAERQAGAELQGGAPASTRVATS